MGGQRGQRMSGLPVEHLRGPDGRPLCGASRRRWGWLFVESGPSCRRCCVKSIRQDLAAVHKIARQVRARAAEKC